MDEVNQFIKVAKFHLERHLHHSGSVLYSSVETLKPADIILMGLNPGGESGSSIGRSLEELPSHTKNAYMEERWANRTGAYEAGQAPLQKRVLELLTSLGYDPRSVCSLNLIFRRTRSAADLDFWKEAEYYWPVHEHLFSLIQPNLILTFGNSDLSAFAFLKSKFNPVSEQTTSALHGSWKCKAISAQYLGRPIQVVGIPHLSRYLPKPAVIDWIKKRLET